MATPGRNISNPRPGTKQISLVAPPSAFESLPRAARRASSERGAPCASWGRPSTSTAPAGRVATFTDRWCTTLRFDGSISMAFAKTSSSKGISEYRVMYGSSPWAGICISTGIGSTWSGGRPLGWCHSSSENAGGGGSFDASPSGAPPSTHAAMVSISSGVSPRALRIGTPPGAACHGGISRDTTLSLMARLQGRTSR